MNSVIFTICSYLVRRAVLCPCWKLRPRALRGPTSVVFEPRKQARIPTSHSSPGDGGNICPWAVGWVLIELNRTPGSQNLKTTHKAPSEWWMDPYSCHTAIQTCSCSTILGQKAGLEVEINQDHSWRSYRSCLFWACSHKGVSHHH